MKDEGNEEGGEDGEDMSIILYQCERLARGCLRFRNTIENCLRFRNTIEMVALKKYLQSPYAPNH
jgi:hypothetical protein